MQKKFKELRKIKSKKIFDEVALVKVQKDIFDLKEKLKQIRLDNTDGSQDHFCGSALVIFERVRYQELFLSYYQTTDWNRFKINFMNTCD